MFIKSKICFTVFVIYEIIAISLLHFQRTCDAMFSTGFCDSNFKYFAGAVAIPLLAYLIWMWIHEIIVARRRRRFINRARKMIKTIASNIHEGFENLSPRAIEGVITAAVLMGVQKYSMRHPDLRKKLSNIIGLSNGEVMDLEYDMDTENAVAASRKTASKKKPAKGAVKKKK